MTKQEELALIEFANANGAQYENAGGYEGYTGEGDDFLEFAGAGGFLTEVEMAEANIFEVSITNLIASAKSLYLTYWDRYGLTIGTNGPSQDGNMRTDTAAPGFKATDGVESFLAQSLTPNVSIEDFIAWVQQNPTRLIGMKIEATTSATQLSQPLVMKKFSPFRQLAETVIRPSTKQNENTFRDKIATIPTPGTQLDGQTQTLYTLNASETVVITFFMGATLNTAKALDNKAAAAVGRNAQAQASRGGVMIRKGR